MHQTDMTYQEIFDRSAKHLLTMKGRSVDEGGRCLYNKEPKGGCAVGVLLFGRTYEFALEVDGPEFSSCVQGLLNVISDNGHRCPVVNKNNLAILQSLQAVHDFKGSWNDDKFVAITGLFRIADDYGLSTEVLEDFG